MRGEAGLRRLGTETGAAQGKCSADENGLCPQALCPLRRNARRPQATKMAFAPHGLGAASAARQYQPSHVDTYNTRSSSALR
jgi:hypothetical protein